MKKIIVLLIIISILIAGIYLYNNGFVVISGTDIKIRKDSIVGYYNSPYTLCVKTNETYNVYIFSSPIQYKDTDGEYKFIDNKLIKSNNVNEKGKKFIITNKQNLTKVYLPQKISEEDYIQIQKEQISIEYFPLYLQTNNYKIQNKENAFGNKTEMAVYESDNISLNTYPNNNGLCSEYVFNNDKQQEIFVKINIEYTHIDINSKGYITAYNNDQIICNYYIYSVEKAFDIKDLDVTENKGEILIKISNRLNYYEKIHTSLDIYVNKQPDSGISSNEPYSNFYLNNISYIGNNELFGECKQLLRFRINSLFKIMPADIKSAYYNTKNLEDEKNQVIQMQHQNTDWSSRNIIWSTYMQGNQKNITTANNIKNYYRFDITEYMKIIAKDRTAETESNGAILNSEKEGDKCTVVSSNDNSLYVPYLNIELYNLPMDFYEIDNINSII